MKLSAKISLAAIGAVVAVVIAAIWIQQRVITMQGLDLVRATMQGAILQAELTRDAMATINKEGAFNKEKLLEEYKASSDPRSTTLYKTIPIVSAWLGLEKAAKSNNFELRIPKFHPRNPKNDPTAEEAKILHFFEEHAQETEYFSVDERNRTITYARPIRLSSDCLSCHGDPRSSPTGDGRDILGIPMEGKKEGDFHAAFILKGTMDQVDHAVHDGMVYAIAWILPLSLFIVIGFYWMNRRMIVNPLTYVVGKLNALARGDLTQIAEIKSSDETGEVANAVNQMSKRLREIMEELGGGIQAATENKGTQKDLCSGMDLMNNQAKTVASAGENLSSNVSNMAASAEEISASTNNVASAVEEMSATINEISKNCAKESQIAEKATRKAQETREVMKKLGDAASEIGKVVDMISSLANQTNLLALNATIEAASAGAAGKGFAVVASAVKELARQSAQATEQITTRIAHIQENTNLSVKAIEEVALVIEEVSQIANTIAAAVEEQSSTINEISKNMSGVSSATNEMAGNVQKSASSATEVSSNIQQISETARQALGKLKSIISQFKL